MTGEDARGGHAPPRSPVLVWLALLAPLAACGGERSLVERFEQSAWQPESFHLASLTGRRDGSEVVFSLVLEGKDPVRLRVDGTIVIDPQARLVSGQWEESGGPSRRSGDLSATAVDFLGGQGGRPSLGGRFLLGAAGDPVYRLNLPATVLDLTPSRP